MKIALPVTDAEICMHFGHCESIYLFDVDPKSQEIIGFKKMNSPPHEPGLLPRLLSREGVNVVLAGGMGARAINLFAQNGIKVVVGIDQVNGSPEDIVQKYLAGSLVTGKNVCDH